MRKKFIIGNWKMHGSKTSVADLLDGLKTADNFSEQVKLVVSPPAIFLDQTQRSLQQSTIRWAAQNMAAEIAGAYTGEISIAMLREFGCHYVLIGHSERRIVFGEKDAIIAKKFQLAAEFNVKPILCIGETAEQKHTGQTQRVLQDQLKAIMALGHSFFEQGIIAYEPVWAIGTGIAAEPEQVQETHQFLREMIGHTYPELAQKLPILYGGSIKPSNAKALFRLPDVDGGLIGGASLHASEFLTIYADCVQWANA
jgi:triosephosphate isomerase (TIM)